MEISYFAIIIGAIFVNNVVLAQFLGICPFLGVSSKVETSMGMGAAVTFVMALTAVVAWPIQTYILVPLHIEYMQTIVFILVIAALVQMVEIMLKKLSPSLYQALGIFLPLITTNCAVLGVAILMIQKEYTLLQSVTYSVATALGFALALVLFAEKFGISPVYLVEVLFKAAVKSPAFRRYVWLFGCAYRLELCKAVVAVYLPVLQKAYVYGVRRAKEGTAHTHVAPVPELYLSPCNFNVAFGAVSCAQSALYTLVVRAV